MRLWQQLLGSPAPPRAAASRDLSWDDYQGLFSFNGLQYPFMQTSMGSINEEQIAQTATAAYHTNGIVFALTLARLQVFSQARFQWTRFKGGSPTDLFGSQELKLLERPWPGGTTSDLLARMEVDITLAGNSYVRRTSSTRVNRLRPEWTIIILGSREDAGHPNEAPDVEVLGYAYRPPSGPMRTFTPDEVAHYAPYPDPDFDFLGMSWVTPGLRDMQADSLATEHKARFFTNAATPNLAIKFDPSIGIDKVKEFKELMESEHRGAWNAYKTLYLGGGADPMVIGKDFRELDFAATQGKGESRLASDAGVPPSWVGFSEGLQGSALNAGNFTAARRRMSDGTLQHLWMNAASSLEPIVGPPTDASGTVMGGTSLWFDLSAVPFMREDAGDLARIQSEEAAVIASLSKDGFTRESVVKAVKNNDWDLLVPDPNWVSVQLQPGSGTPAPAANGNGAPQASVNGANS